MAKPVGDTTRNLVVLACSALAAITSPAISAQERPGILHGVALDDKGKPIAGAMVQAVKPKALHTFQLDNFTDSRGEFTVMGLAPGAYNVYVIKEEEGYGNQRAAIYSQEPNVVPVVQITEGATTEVTVNRGVRDGRIVASVTSSATGLPSPKLGYSIRLSAAESFLGAGALGGQFVVPVPASPVILEVRAEGYETFRSAPIQVPAGQTKMLAILLKPSK
jgi:hypothetical protein